MMMAKEPKRLRQATAGIARRASSPRTVASSSTPVRPGMFPSAMISAGRSRRAEARSAVPLAAAAAEEALSSRISTKVERTGSSSSMTSIDTGWSGS